MTSLYNGWIMDLNVQLSLEAAAEYIQESVCIPPALPQTCSITNACRC